MSDTEAKPALKAVEKPAEEPKSTLRSEKELRQALLALQQRHALQRQFLMTVSLGRSDWHGIMDGAADLREIEAHSEALEFALGLRDTIR